MTKTNMDLSELLSKHDQDDFLRGIAKAVLQLLVETDVEGLIGMNAAASGRPVARSPNSCAPGGPSWPTFRETSEHQVLAYMTFPRQHRTNLHSTNPIERLNKEVKRRSDVVGIFPNEASIMRPIGAVLFDANDDWQTSSRSMMVEAFAQIDKKKIDPILSITTKAA